MIKVVFLRHGLSTWNVENRFTGWSDVDLAPLGIEEARTAGRMLKQEGYEFDCAFTSVLKRAIRTLWLVQEVMDQMWVPVERDWRLNERHYGALQGLHKTEVAEHYGAQQVHEWRRGFAIRPPAMSMTDPRLPHHDPRYRAVSSAALPWSESLADTMKRAIACWEERIMPRIRQDGRVLIVAHGNTLRALIKHLEGVSDEGIMKLEIPTGIPLVYEFDNDFEVMSHYYLNEPAEPFPQREAHRESPLRA